MSDENARLFMLHYIDDVWGTTVKEILVSRAAVAQYEVRRLKSNHRQVTSGQAAVATAADHFAGFDSHWEEIYFTCEPYKMGRQIEISPCSWVETLPSFRVIEVRKRKRAVRDQAAVSGPR
jgi:hypothetical protein